MVDSITAARTIERLVAVNCYGKTILHSDCKCRYYKLTGVLPPTWKYESSTASTMVA